MKSTVRLAVNKLIWIQFLGGGLKRVDLQVLVLDETAAEKERKKLRTSIPCARNEVHEVLEDIWPVVSQIELDEKP